MSPSIYLDSSAISKRYIGETGTKTVDFIFDDCEIDKIKISFSMWNIGEVIGVFDKYYNRKLITTDIFKESIKKFLVEIEKLYKLKTLHLLPINSEILVKSLPLILKYHIYQADAVQIISFETANCDIFISADQKLVNIMKTINKMSFNIETEEKEIERNISI